MNARERLEAARTDREILAELAAIVWAKLGSAGDPPEVSSETLAERWDEIPRAAVREAGKLLHPVAVRLARSHLRKAADKLSCRWEPEGEGGGLAAMTQSHARGTELRMWFDPATVHEEWARNPTGKHPEGPLVRAFLKLPPKVEANTRNDPIMPVVQSVAESPERTAGRLAFGGLLEAGDDPPQADLPLFPETEAPRVGLLEAVNRHGVRVMARGRGAPLPLRVFVGSAILTPQAVRTGRAVLATTVREFRDFAFPKRWQAGRDWPRLRTSLLEAGDLWTPDGRGGLWKPLAVRRIPGSERPGLDEEILLDVWLPPGSQSGPPIDRWELALLGVESAPKFLAYIAAHSVAWLPGKTRIPHPKNRRVTIWTGNRNQYPILSTADRDRLAFGSKQTIRARSRKTKDAPWGELPGVEILSTTEIAQDGRRGWLIVPKPAAEAIWKRESGST